MQELWTFHFKVHSFPGTKFASQKLRSMKLLYFCTEGVKVPTNVSVIGANSPCTEYCRSKHLPQCYQKPSFSLSLILLALLKGRVYFRPLKKGVALPLAIVKKGVELPLEHIKKG